MVCIHLQQLFPPHTILLLTILKKSNLRLCHRHRVQPGCTQHPAPAPLLVLVLPTPACPAGCPLGKTHDTAAAEGGERVCMSRAATGCVAAAASPDQPEGRGEEALTQVTKGLPSRHHPGYLEHH